MTAETDLVVDVQLASEVEGVPSREFIRSWVCRALAASGRDIAPGTELSVRVVDTEEVRALNREYRDQDKATNVLSFPGGQVTGLPPHAGAVLGDIVVCAAVVSSEAEAQGKAVADHWAHLLVHGTLHLVGFDHDTATEAAEMEALETRILEQHGIADPYGETR